MTKERAPFTFVAAFTVSPLWMADGFTLTDERAHDMLWKELGCTHAECGARVIHGPTASAVARVQGYTRPSPRRTAMEREYHEGTPHRLTLMRALDRAISVSKAAGDGQGVAALYDVRDLLTKGLPLEANTQPE